MTPLKLWDFCAMSDIRDTEAKSVLFRDVQTHFRKSVQDNCSRGIRLEKAGERTPKLFLRHGQARQILDEEELRKWIVGKIIHPLASEEQIAGDCGKILGAPGLRIILLTIITRGTIQMLDNFQSHFLDEDCDKNDDHLPFDINLANEHFGEKEGSKFFRAQFVYNAVTLKAGVFREEFQALRILPYLSEKRLGSGNVGAVWEVKIERGHFSYNAPVSRNADVSSISLTSVCFSLPRN